MDICIASDDNYSSIMSVLILSIFENNRGAEDVTVHVFEDRISPGHKNTIQAIATKYNRKIIFYDIKKHIDSLRENINNDWANRNSYVAYARLYMPDMLPASVEKFLYLDCDTLVCSSLIELFNIDISEYIAGAVRDVLPSCYKASLDLDEYFNSGILLINSKLWQSNGITNDIFKYCNSHADDHYPDQDAINVVLKDKIKILPPKYCVFYPEYMATAKDQIYWYGADATYYGEEELVDAMRNTAIIHYVDSILGRPWQKNNINPYTNIWMKYYELLDDSMKFVFKNKLLSTNQKIFRIIYKTLPFKVFVSLYYYRKNQGIRNILK